MMADFYHSLYGKFMSTGISLVALFWTRSTSLILPMKYGPHMVLRYSRRGRTIDVNRSGRVSSSNATNNILINPRIEFHCVWNFS